MGRVPQNYLLTNLHNFLLYYRCADGNVLQMRYCNELKFADHASDGENYPLRHVVAQCLL